MTPRHNRGGGGHPPPPITSVTDLRGVQQEGLPQGMCYMPRSLPQPRVCMRTHVGQHLLRKECVKGQEEISLATACGFCGDRVTCSTQVVMRSKQTHALVTLMICDCPSQLSCAGTSLRKYLQAARARIILCAVPYAQSTTLCRCA